ncbi:MAG: nucleoside hydrolase [Pirellulales bacterium]|nr:nucleoside hydrolase [Pirellulales bacterium]
MRPAQALKTISVVWSSCILLASTTCSSTMAQTSVHPKKIPVILDTDIGDDIDDTWALVLLLRCPELDLKLVVGDYGKRTYRASLIAKLLETAGRTDIDVGLGIGNEAQGTERQSEWVSDYHLTSYPGTVHQDGVQAIIDTIMNSPEPVTLISIGPVPNIEAALDREPRIAEKARFVGMYGSVRKGYGGQPSISPEWNVRANPKACQKALSSPWPITITPLDTCGLVHLQGEKYAAVRDCKDPFIQGLVENYRIWWRNSSEYSKNPQKDQKGSSTLFDTVAVYLAFAQELCKMEMLPIRVTDDGMTVIDPKAQKMNVATEWKDLGAYEDFLVDRLTGKK